MYPPCSNASTQIWVYVYRSVWVPKKRKGNRDQHFLSQSLRFLNITISFAEVPGALDWYQLKIKGNLVSTIKHYMFLRPIFQDVWFFKRSVLATPVGWLLSRVILSNNFIIGNNALGFLTIHWGKSMEILGSFNSFFHRAAPGIFVPSLLEFGFEAAPNCTNPSLLVQLFLGPKMVVVNHVWLALTNQHSDLTSKHRDLTCFDMIWPK